MKRFLALTLIITMAAAVWPKAAAALTDYSFTARSTQGMFEDMYDLFHYSPVYMNTFKKNAFWGQLANIASGSDEVFNNSGSEAYTLAGQMETGFGRAGLALDWYSYSDAVPGFTETTTSTYTVNNNMIVSRRENYTSYDKTSNHYDTDIYAAYGLASLVGLDLGAAVRAYINANDPTHNPDVGGNEGSFTYKNHTHTYDVITGLLTERTDASSSGSLSYGSTWLEVIVGAGLNDLLPGWGLVANLRPYLTSYGNNLKWETTSSTVNVTTGATDYSRTQRQEGYYDGYSFPGTGLGVTADVRADYALAKNILFTGLASVDTNGRAYDKPKFTSYDNTFDPYQTIDATYGLVTVTDNTTIDNQGTYEGKSGALNFELHSRVQFLGNGWKLGLGLNGMSWGSSNSYTLKQVNNTTTVHTSGTPDPSQDWTSVRTSGYTEKYEYEGVTNQLELPLGFVISVLKNLNLNLGVKHTISATTSTSTTQYTDRQPDTTQTTYRDGTQTVTVNSPGTVTDETRNSDFDVDHQNEFIYGATWFFNDQVQLDVMGFSNLTDLSDWRVALNIYF